MIFLHRTDDSLVLRIDALFAQALQARGVQIPKFWGHGVVTASIVSACRSIAPRFFWGLASHVSEKIYAIAHSSGQSPYAIHPAASDADVFANRRCSLPCRCRLFRIRSRTRAEGRGAARDRINVVH